MPDVDLEKAAPLTATAYAYHGSATRQPARDQYRIAGCETATTPGRAGSSGDHHTGEQADWPFGEHAQADREPAADAARLACDRSVRWPRTGQPHARKDHREQQEGQHGHVGQTLSREDHEAERREPETRGNQPGARREEIPPEHDNNTTHAAPARAEGSRAAHSLTPNTRNAPT